MEKSALWGSLKSIFSELFFERSDMNLLLQNFISENPFRAEEATPLKKIQIRKFFNLPFTF